MSENTERDELADLIASVTIDTKSGDVLRVHPDGETPVFEGDQRTANALLAAGYRKPRAITTVEELDALPYGTAVAHDEGWGITVAQRHAEDLRWYVTGCLEYIRPEALIPATVVYEIAYFEATL